MTLTSKTFLALLVLLFSATRSGAQQARIISTVATLRTEVNGYLDPSPVIALGSDEDFEVSFDEFSHNYHRFLYRLEHLDRLWRPSSDLFFSEYAEATQTDIPIEDYTESQNVTTLYTHYSFRFPNADIRPLVSGNYRITILLDDDDEPLPVAEVYFGVTENAVAVKGSVTTDTETDYNDRHQQVTFSVDCPSLPIRDCREDIFTTVLQNGRWDNAVIGAPPTSTALGHLTWDHQRALVFPAGNEYRKFEILSARYPGLNVESVRWFDPYIHATISTDEVCRNYLTTEDQNGINVIRNTDNQDDATETEYMVTHFALHVPEPFDDADVYLSGKWTTGGIVPEWKLTYNTESRCYEGAFMLKQGYYNYQYLVVPQGTSLPAPNSTSHTAAAEGDHFQTSNEYRILVYFSTPGCRYHRLVGTALLQSGKQ